LANQFLVPTLLKFYQNAFTTFSNIQRTKHRDRRTDGCKTIRFAVEELTEEKNSFADDSQ